MKKRGIALLLAVSFLLGLSGCSALFKKEYLSVSEYTEGEYDEYDDYMCDVASYAELKRAISQIVTKHSEEERIRFAGYDGSIQGDLAQACWELKNENALTGYVVDYMSYDLNRIVTYYEAVIYVAYKHSKQDVDDIINVADLSALESKLQPVLSELSNYVVFHIPDSELVEGDVVSAVERAYAKDPTACVVMPTVKIQIHPKSGVFRIAEIELYYGRTQTVIDGMRVELTDRLAELSGKLQTDDKSVYILDAYNLLVSNCSYDADGSLRSEKKLDADLSTTAYGALVQGLADSQGIAAAFSALCMQADIPCIMVEGSVDGEKHFWNIVELDGRHYHVDVSADSTWGMSNSFLVSDEKLQSRYQWDTALYPACEAAE